MGRDIIRSDNAPTSPLYSQAVRAGGLLFISGMTGADPRTGKLAGDTIGEQARQAMVNCQAILAEANATLDDVVEVGVLLADPSDFGALNEEYASWFSAEPPARYVAKLGVEIPGLLVSIRMTAALGEPQHRS